jgi:hypothetical protein
VPAVRTRNAGWDVPHRVQNSSGHVNNSIQRQMRRDFCAVSPGHVLTTSKIDVSLNYCAPALLSSVLIYAPILGLTMR